MAKGKLYGRTGGTNWSGGARHRLKSAGSHPPGRGPPALSVLPSREGLPLSDLVACGRAVAILSILSVEPRGSSQCQGHLPIWVIHIYGSREAPVPSSSELLGFPPAGKAASGPAGLPTDAWREEIFKATWSACQSWDQNLHILTPCCDSSPHSVVGRSLFRAHPALSLKRGVGGPLCGKSEQAGDSAGP